MGGFVGYLVLLECFDDELFVFHVASDQYVLLAVPHGRFDVIPVAHEHHLVVIDQFGIRPADGDVINDGRRVKLCTYYVTCIPLL